MDTIVKGGVIWEYLKGEVVAGKEQMTKNDLMKVGYSAQSIENAIAEIKKEMVLNRSAAELRPVVPAPVKESSPAAFVANDMTVMPTERTVAKEITEISLKTRSVEQDLINDLNAAIKQDTKTEFQEPAHSIQTPLPVLRAASRGAIPGASHENLGAFITNIPVIAPDLVHGQTTPSPTTQAPTQIPPAPLLPRKKSIFRKLLLFLLFILVLFGIGSGILYGMTGIWLPPSILEQIESLGIIGKKYSNEELFTVMLEKISSIKSFVYSAGIDAKTIPYDGRTIRPTMATTSTLGVSASGSSPLLSMPIAEIDLRVGITGVSEVGDQNTIIDGTSQLHATFSGNAGAVPLSGEADLVKIGEGLYLKIKKFPTIGVFDLSKIDDKWVKFDATGTDELEVSFRDLYSRVLQAETLLRLLQEKSTTGEYVGTERIGNEYAAQYKVLFSGSEASLWISKKTALPLKITFTSVAAYAEDHPTMKDKMTAYATEVILSGINEAVTIMPPEVSLTAIEAYALLTGVTVEEYYEKKQESNVLTIFYALEDYKRIAGEYPPKLSELTKTPNQLRRENPKKAAKKSAVKAGFDFAPWGDELPVLAKIPTDVYVKTDYAYTAYQAGKDFKLIYEIRRASSSLSSKVPSKFVNGTNTMTSRAVSMEAINKQKK